ncbi:kinase-like protein [Auriculariales sp. MPI-PUGE-AT-0066]|nr:kinase-like protein [Auriculariales sp. MPI-PUGE-AT-0066]
MEQQASYGGLLRLLTSPFFSVNLAVSYLSLYSENIGVTWYLVRRLREKADPLRLPWGLLLHVLLTRPSKSAALENFILESATEHTHVALITLWFMQAYLRDEKLTRNPRAFQRIQRVLHRTHEIIFAAPTNLVPTPYARTSITAQVASVFGNRKVKPNAESIVVGVGMITAAIAVPNFATEIGNIAVEQGRYEDSNELLRSVEVIDPDPDDDDPPILPAVEEPDELAKSGFFPRARSQKLSDVLDLSGGEAASVLAARRRSTLAAQTVPSLILRPSTQDPFGQNDTHPPVSPTLAAPTPPYMSTPSFHIATPSVIPAMPDKLLSSLLRSHYCRSEVSFVLALESISNRLLVIPKPARVSALRAELTDLNHKLPAEVCLPLWCSSADEPVEKHRHTQPHHRVVRIPPGESVVLNSAERAPYVLLIEVLGDELSFDPTRRDNKETLKKIVVDPSSGFPTSRQSTANMTAWSADAVVSANAQSALAPHTSVDDLSTSPMLNGEITSEPPEDEEVDLVEQMYGPVVSMRDSTLDLSDTFVLPAAPRHKDLDIATWSRNSISQPGTPPLTASHGHSQSVGTLGTSIPRIIGGGHARTFSSPERADNAEQASPLPTPSGRPALSLEEYSERMRTAAVMLAQLNATIVNNPAVITSQNVSHPNAAAADGSADQQGSTVLSWLPGTGWIRGSVEGATTRQPILRAEAESIRNRIMQEMMQLEEERMERMRGGDAVTSGTTLVGKSAEDEGIIRRELNKADPSATVFRESWAAKRSRIRQASPYGHLMNWDVISVIVKTGADLRQEQLAIELIQELDEIWKEEKCGCWVRPFKILITGGSSGLIETLTDAVSVHSIKKAEYARRLTEGGLGYVSLADHYRQTFGDPSSAKYARAQRNFAKSLAGYSLVTYLLQLRDRHNGNILVDSDGHIIHIDFGFMLGNSPGNIGVEAAPFKFTAEYLDVLNGIDSLAFKEFKKLFHDGFEAARKHSERLISIVQLMQRESSLPCFLPYGEQTAQHLRDRFHPTLKNDVTMPLHLERLMMTSLGSHWTRLYDSFQYYSQGVLN